MNLFGRNEIKFRRYIQLFAGAGIYIYRKRAQSDLTDGIKFSRSYGEFFRSAVEA